MQKTDHPPTPDLPDDPENTIWHAVHCGRCAYNLKSRRYTGICPECGNEYDARPLRMKGILLGEDVQWPTGDLVATMLSFTMAWILITAGLTPLEPGYFVAASFFVAMGVIFGWLTMKRSVRCLHLRSALRRVERGET